MAFGLDLDPGPGQTRRELLESGMPRFIGPRTRPNPCHTQRRFPPALRSTTVRIGHRDRRPRASHRRYRLRPELQRHAGLNREKEQPRANHANIGELRHKSIPAKARSWNSSTVYALAVDAPQQFVEYALDLGFGVGFEVASARPPG